MHCPTLGAVGSGTPAMHRLTALGAVDSATPAMHCLTAWGQWAVQLLQYTAALLGGSGQRNSCYALPHWLGGSGQWTSGNTLPHCLGAVSSAAPALLCPTAWGQWTVQLLQFMPHCLGAVGSGTPAMHCLTAWGQWAVELLQCAAPLAGGIGQCNFCNTLPHCLGEWATQLLHCTASLPWGSGQLNSCNALPHCLGAVGSATPAMHCLTALGAVGSATPAMGGRSVVPGLWGCTTGRTGLGGGESNPGGGRGILQGLWGAIIFGEPGAPAWGGRGVQARGWSEPPAGPMGRRHLLITGRTGLGGTGSPAQGVVGTSASTGWTLQTCTNYAL